MTLRNQDNRTERIVAEFLDKHFYPHQVTQFERFHDKKMQLKGIDVKFDYAGKTRFVDEKTAAHYVNKNLPTFAFELDFIGRDSKLHQGWFLDKKKKTDHYLLTWIWAKREKNFTCDDITQLDIILVNGNKIRQMLVDNGLSKTLVIEKTKQLRTNKKYGVSGKVYGKPYYFYFTKHLSEQPINLIITKRKLKEISTLNTTILI